MRARLVAFALGLLCQTAQASERWVFTDRTAVTDKPSAGVFHHLEGAGRRHIAVSSQSVAVTWEDNQTQDPQVYVAIKALQETGFSKPLQVSRGVEAYEPAIAALSGQRFILSWEQDGAVYSRLLVNDQLSPALKLSSGTAGHATVAAKGEHIFVAWREQINREWYLKLAHLRVDENNKPAIVSTTNIESAGLKYPVLFPSLAVNSAGLVVAWEDRRAGHTRLLFSLSADQGRSFSPPQNLNEFYSNRNEYDKGNGVTRVSITGFAEDEILAAWMDKRRGGAGYGIFAALGTNVDSFGPNEKVHGHKGDLQPHYNPVTAGNLAGDFVVAWDDFRNGDSDIWISRYNEDEEWALDFAPSIAAGAGEQSHPSITLDEQGNLHLLWMERIELNAPSRLWYSLGKADKID